MPEEFPPTLDRRSDDARPSCGSPPTERDRPSRRSFLANVGSATAGLAATAGLGATAGCVELLPAMGQEVRYDDVELPEAPPPRYREWAPASSVGGDDVGLSMEFVAIPNSGVESVTGVRAEYGRVFIAAGIDYFGVGFGNYDLAFWLAGGQNDVFVLEGPIAPAEIGPVLEDSGYAADGEHRGYDRYVREDIPRTVTVIDGRILFGKGPDRDATIDLVLDARAGEVPRATEDPGFVQITDAARTRPFLMLGEDFSGIFDDFEIEQFAVGIDFDESAFYYCHYFRFADEVPARDAIRDEVESLELGDGAESVDAERDGQFVSIVIETGNDAVQSDFELAGQPPQCTWGVEADEGGYHIVHEAGEAVPAEHLSVRSTHADHGVLDVQFTDEYETVGPGDSLYVPADVIDEGPLVVVWEGEDSTAALLEYSP